MERLFRRARLPLAMSEGFHPKVRMSFPSALALGVAGMDEAMELECTEQLEAGELLDRLNNVSVPGLCFLSAAWLAPGEKKAAITASVFEWTVPESARDAVKHGLKRLLDTETVPIEKPNGKTVDVRKAIQEASLCAETCKMSVTLLSTQGSDAGVREVLKSLNLDQELFRSIFPVRIRVLL